MIYLDTDNEGGTPQYYNLGYQAYLARERKNPYRDQAGQEWLLGWYTAQQQEQTERVIVFDGED